MNGVTAYFFQAPVNGRYLTGLACFFALLFVVALVAHLVGKRAGLRSVRRRFFRLRSIMLVTAILGSLYLFCRFQQVSFLNLRIWLWLILVGFGVSLVWWLLRLRTLTVDAVEERTQRRRRSYFQRGRKRRPAKRRRRR